MFENDGEIPDDICQERFTKYFDAEIRAILNSVSVNKNVYNGTHKVTTDNKFFMDPKSVDAIFKV
jgi:hypothetical protein